MTGKAATTFPGFQGFPGAVGILGWCYPVSVIKHANYLQHIKLGTSSDCNTCMQLRSVLLRTKHIHYLCTKLGTSSTF